MQLKVTHLGDILPSVLHGYQVFRAMNDEFEPIFVFGSKEKRALEWLFKLSVKLIK